MKTVNNIRFNRNTAKSVYSNVARSSQLSKRKARKEETEMAENLLVQKSANELRVIKNHVKKSKKESPISDEGYLCFKKSGFDMYSERRRVNRKYKTCVGVYKVIRFDEETMETEYEYIGCYYT